MVSSVWRCSHAHALPPPRGRRQALLLPALRLDWHAPPDGRIHAERGRRVVPGLPEVRGRGAGAAEESPRQQLRARYPAILAHASLSYGDGWAGIMETLCERLQFHAEHNGMPPVEITQAKEKHGELSVNYAGGNGYAGALVDMAEALSARVCEGSAASPASCPKAKPNTLHRAPLKTRDCAF